MALPSGLATTVSDRRLLKRPLVFIAFVALTLLLAVVFLLYEQQLSPERDYFQFGWEVGRVARSIGQFAFGDSCKIAVISYFVIAVELRL
jgi:hypothetical protein